MYSGCFKSLSPQQYICGGVEYTLSHIGVPIFYLISGYYLYSGDAVREHDKLKRKIIHSLKLLAIFMLVSLGYQAMISLFRFHGLNHLIKFISDRCTLNNYTVDIIK